MIEIRSAAPFLIQLLKLLIQQTVGDFHETPLKPLQADRNQTVRL
jgi:hypothetical protein